MRKGDSYLKQTGRKAKRVISGAVIGVLGLGLAASGTASANGYGNHYTGHGGYGSGVSYHYVSKHNTSNQHRYTQYRWVFDPYLGRWVLVGYNYNTSRWERCDRDNSGNHDRYSRSGNYWYGMHDDYSY